jgi:hypothetical protein
MSDMQLALSRGRLKRIAVVKDFFPASELASGGQLA